MGGSLPAASLPPRPLLQLVRVRLIEYHSYHSTYSVRRFLAMLLYVPVVVVCPSLTLLWLFLTQRIHGFSVRWKEHLLFWVHRIRRVRQLGLGWVPSPPSLPRGAHMH